MLRIAVRLGEPRSREADEHAAPGCAIEVHGAKLTPMTVQEYLKLADTCLAKVAAWLEDFDPDEVDFSTTDGMVTIEFPDKAKFVLNRQSGNHQMWFAAGVRAWHYAWNPERQSWLDDRDGHDLYDRLGEVVSEKIGRPVHLS